MAADRGIGADRHLGMIGGEPLIERIAHSVQALEFEMPPVAAGCTERSASSSDDVAPARSAAPR